MTEEQERSKLAADVIVAYLEGIHGTPYKAAPIKWREDGLRAIVTINDVELGPLLQVYNQLRTSDNFVAWLKNTVSEAQYNREMDRRLDEVLANRPKPWLRYHDGE